MQWSKTFCSRKKQHKRGTFWCKELRLNRIGNSLFVKTLLGFIKQNWVYEYNGDVSLSL